MSVSKDLYKHGLHVQDLHGFADGEPLALLPESLDHLALLFPSLGSSSVTYQAARVFSSSSPLPSVVPIGVRSQD